MTSLQSKISKHVDKQEKKKNDGNKEKANQ